MSCAVDSIYESPADQKVRWSQLHKQFAAVHGRIWTRDQETEVTRNHRWWVTCIKGIFATLASITETIRFISNTAVHGIDLLQNEVYTENEGIDLISWVFFNALAVPFVITSWAATVAGLVPEFAGSLIDWMENNGYCGALPRGFVRS